MPEEKEQKKHQEVQAEKKEEPEGKPAQKKVEEKPKAETPGQAEEEKDPAVKKEARVGSKEKGRKISRMTLAEVDAELKTVKEKMGGFQSAFAHHLLARKKELSE